MGKLFLSETNVEYHWNTQNFNEIYKTCKELILCTPFESNIFQLQCESNWVLNPFEALALRASADNR